MATDLLKFEAAARKYQSAVVRYCYGRLGGDGELALEVFDDVLGEGFADSVKEAGAIDPRKLGEALAAKSVEDLNELSHALKRL